MPEIITSKKNRLFTHYRKLGADRAYRRECGELLGDGAKLLGDAINCGYPLNTVLLCDESIKIPGDIPVSVTSAELMRGVSPLDSPQGVLFTAPSPLRTLPEKLPTGKYIVLDAVRDPGNVGTVIRSADAFSVDGVILTEDCADLLSIKTVRATMGGIFRQKIYEASREEIISALKTSKLPVFTAELTENAEDITKVKFSCCAVIIGNEGAGVSEKMREIADKIIKIPMSDNCQSLNAAVSASVIMWEMYKRQE